MVTAPPDPFGQILELFAPDGSRLAGNSTSRAFNANAVEIDDFVLPVAGTYTIRVRDSGDDNTGSFTLGVSDQPITDPTALAAFNQVVSGAIDSIGDVDDHVFSATAGTVVTIERNSGSFVDITLLGPDGQVVSGGGTSDPRLHLVTLPADGDYVVRIEPSGGTVGGSLDDTGAYSFTVWTPDRDPTPIPIDFGQQLAATVAAEGDLVDFRLEVLPEHLGRPVSIVVTAPPDPFGQILELFGPDDARLAVNSTSRAFNVNAVEIDDFVLPVEGVYTIRVRDSGDDNTGSFTLGVSDQAITSPTALAGFNQVVSGAIDSIGDVDDHVFSATAGTVVTIERNSGSFVDITLLGPDGVIVSGGGTNDTRLHLVTLPADGDYIVRIEPMGGTISSQLDDTGAYSFTVWTPDRDPVPIPNRIWPAEARRDRRRG